MEDILLRYNIDKDGNVVNKKTKKQIRPQDNGKGYKKVTLTINSKQIQRYIHRLVASIYLSNENGYNQVNHINGIKNDNRVENLEWCTNSLNQIHAQKTHLKSNGNELWNGKFSKEQIAKIKEMKSNGILQYKIAEIMGTTKGTISEILSGKRYKYI
jgi:predicted P-loop ATPase